MRPALAGIALISTASAPLALADAPTLSWPLDCELGVTCYIEDYVDLDPGSGQRDYTCSVKTRDGHQGTDFQLLSFDAMNRGVQVRAAAPGTVTRIRDGMEDVAVTPDTIAEMQSVGCGNAVLVDHGGGWSTHYCHLKKGSVAVSIGQTVPRGAPLGEVGLSGLTNAPHLHLGVSKDGQTVDPFLPEDAANTCGAADGPGLWDNTIPYDKAGLFTAGFATSVPSLDAVVSGAARVRDMTSDAAMVVYGFAHFAKPGDRMALWAEDAGGAEVFRTQVVLDDPEFRLFRAYGRRAPEGGWAPGAYRGFVRLTRDGRVIAHRHADLSVISR